MCGIAGFSGIDSATVSNSVLKRLQHRGPDGSGRFDADSGNVSLFHTRLAIQDPTSDGAQPMAAADGQVVITFNGEIYNFPILRKQLESRGYTFRSRTDTEVILALYLEYGVDCLARLNGIYAFAIWDARDRSLFVARDGMGVKPLYFSEVGNAFAFASEIKALICFPWIPRDLDSQALLHYVRFLWCPAPRTPLTDVKKLEPGMAMVVRDGVIKRRWQHFELPCSSPQPDVSAMEWGVKVTEALGLAVERQMIADVPVGAFLSGGLDSSAVVASARQHSRRRLQCFTIDFDSNDARSEGVIRDLPYARRVAEHLDVDLHVVNADAQMANELDQMVWQLDEPLADFSALNVLAISRLAREHGIKVLLSGAGGDDIFSGYRRHRALGLDAIWNRTPGSLRKLVSKIGRQLPRGYPGIRRIAKLLEVAGLDRDERLVAYFNWASPGTVQPLFAPGFADAEPERPLLDWLHHLPRSASQLQKMLLLDQRFFLADHNLIYTDKMSMAAGVETRVPFLDPDLVSLAARIPDNFRQRGPEGKWILKQAMRGMLPDDIIFRPKTGFGVPLRAWLRGPLQPLVDDVFSANSMSRRGILNADAVRGLLRQNDAGAADHAYSILSLVCIELWCRRFMDDNPA